MKNKREAISFYKFFTEQEVKILDRLHKKEKTQNVVIRFDYPCVTYFIVTKSNQEGKLEKP